MCQYCKAEFAQSIELTRHVRTHTGDRPYVCRECGKGYSQAHGLSIHLQTFHSKRTHRTPAGVVKCIFSYSHRTGGGRFYRKEESEVNKTVLPFKARKRIFSRQICRSLTTVRNAVSVFPLWRSIVSTCRSSTPKSFTGVPPVIRYSPAPPCWTNTRAHT